MQIVYSTFRRDHHPRDSKVDFSILRIQLSLALGKKGIPIHIYWTRISINIHTRTLYFSRLRVQPSVKFLFSSRDMPRCARSSANFLNDPLKHFSFTSLFHRLLLARLCFGSSAIFVLPRSFSFAGERRRNATTYYGLFSPSPLLSAHFEKSFALATPTSVKTARARRRCEAFSMPREQFR